MLRAAIDKGRKLKGSKVVSAEILAPVISIYTHPEMQAEGLLALGDQPLTVQGRVWADWEHQSR
jgi:hypothetical protein